MKNQVDAGIKIEALSIGWMVIEALVSIWSGMAVGSTLLTAFGLDSTIELVSAGVLLWRLRIEAKKSPAGKIERAEKSAQWVVAVALALLGMYVLATSFYGLYARLKPDNSAAGFLISLIAVIGMPILSGKKKKIAKRIDSKALASDASCTMVCAYMASSVLLGLVLNYLFGWWWAEHIAALLFLYWLLRETKEAFETAQNKIDRCNCC